MSCSGQILQLLGIHTRAYCPFPYWRQRALTGAWPKWHWHNNVAQTLQACSLSLFCPGGGVCPRAYGSPAPKHRRRRQQALTEQALRQPATFCAGSVSMHIFFVLHAFGRLGHLKFHDRVSLQQGQTPICFHPCIDYC